MRWRSFTGVVVKEWLRYELALMVGAHQRYLRVTNRNELLEAAPDSVGYRCDWQWTSDLYAPKIIPMLGQRLMKRALANHPIRRTASADNVEDVQPQVTFLIGHRGMSRLPHLLATLQSIAAQNGAVVECIVIEQDTVSQLGPLLPAWVRLVHTPPPAPDMPYCRSWTFNVGAQHARAGVLVLHDNDMLVPVDYAASILDRVRRGYDVVNLKRFIFYLTQAHTEAVFSAKADLMDAAPEVIVQNLEGGGSVAITRSGFDRIGGMDESFMGWGGEDNEFWERAQTLRVWPWANLPIVHLWHAAQPGKHEPNNPIWAHYHFCSSIPSNKRIAHLRLLNQGNMVGPYRC
jgi:hypothetical protein